MGLFDKLLGHGQERQEEKALSAAPNTALPEDASDIEKAITEKTLI